jgi:DNA-binding MarR family transcriptional regulator
MRTDHVVALISRVREAANGLLCSEMARLGHTGLSPSHGGILGLLYERGPVPMGELAEGIGRKKNTVTTLVRTLVEAGYVSRKVSPLDSRVSIVSLTPKGHAFRADFEAISRSLLDTTWGDMEPGRRQDVVAALERMLGNLS